MYEGRACLTISSHVWDSYEQWYESNTILMNTWENKEFINKGAKLLKVNHANEAHSSHQHERMT